MMRSLARVLRAAVAVSLAAAPAFAQFEVRVAPEARAAVRVGVPLAPTFAAGTTLSPALAAPALTPALALPFSAAAAPSAAPISAAAVAVPAAPVAARAALTAPAAEAIPVAALAAAADAVPAAPTAQPHGRASFLSSAFAAARPAATTAPRSWGRFFDGGARAAAADAAPAVTAVSGARAAALAPASAPAKSAAASVPAPRTSRSRAGSRLALAATVAVLLLAFATPAFAATAAAAPFTAEATMSVLAALHPAASALGAAIGVVFGLMSAKRADGTSPNSGDVFGSAVRYGVLGGAGVYILLDLAQSAFTGFSATALNPLSTALATAALGHTAFGGKFGDAATTSADRIMSAFPAVAAALGFTATTLMAASVASWPVALHSLAAGALTATGLAAAFYSTLFTPGRSAADGPARMAKGWVLQALMGGLAFAVASPWLAVPFAALAVWGFGDVLYAAGQEIWSALKAFLNHTPVPPAPPTPPTPPTPDPAPKA